MGFFSKLFGLNKTEENEIDESTAIDDDALLLDLKGVTENTLNNLSDNRGED